MTLDGQPGIIGIHAFAIVFDPHLLFAAELDVNRQPTRPGVDGVLDQLLDDRRGSLDHFPGGNLVGEVFWESSDSTHASLRRAHARLHQSPTFTDKAACAAASRATGTRYGDALT